MNWKKNLIIFVCFVALLTIVGNVMAQSMRPTKKLKTTPEESSSLDGPKKLPSPTDQIEAKKINIRTENPVWSPDGKKIAFIRVNDELSLSDNDPTGRQLYIIEANQPVPKLISSVSLDPKNFCWSPDSKKICFVETEISNYNIYTIDLATKKRIKITNHNEHPSSFYHYLSWSSDGTKLAFAVGQGSGNYHIWIADAQGKFWFKLTEGFNPIWFPDSKKIAFAVGTPDGESSLSTIDIDGKNLKKIKNPDGKVFSNLRDIYLSPDSKSVFCASSFFLNVTHPDVGQLTTTTIFGDESDGSPIILGSNSRVIAVAKADSVQILDISKLIFTGTPENNSGMPNDVVISQFKVTNLTEKRGEQATVNDPYRGFWSWSPDNKEIAFVGKDNEIWKMSSNGTNQKQLTFEITKLVQLARQEQEKKLALAREELASELKK